MLKIETNTLLDSYLIHMGINKKFQLRSPYFSRCDNKRRIFKDGLILDDGAIVFRYLKKGVDYKHYKKMGVNYGLSDYEMHTNKIIIDNPVNFQILRLEDAYEVTLMGSLILASAKVFKRILKIFSQSNFIEQADNFAMIYHVSSKEEFLEDVDCVSDITSCHQFIKVREGEEYHKIDWWNQTLRPRMAVIFNKSTYFELKSTWIEDHLKEKYGSLEEARRICQEKHPDIFAFAEKLKEKK